MSCTWLLGMSSPRQRRGSWGEMDGESERDRERGEDPGVRETEREERFLEYERRKEGWDTEDVMMNETRAKGDITTMIMMMLLLMLVLIMLMTLLLAPYPCLALCLVHCLCLPRAADRRTEAAVEHSRHTADDSDRSEAAAGRPAAGGAGLE